MYLHGGRVLWGDELHSANLYMEHGKIANLAAGEGLDVSGCLILPGFFDLHTHGGDGVDVNAADAEGLRKIGRFFARQGVTGWLCSILTDTEEQTLRCIEQAKQVIGRPYDGAALLGIHLEGPCLCPAYKGAMPEHLLMTRADLTFFEKCQRAAGGAIKYVTLSPEVDGVPELIPELVKLGMTVALGHSGATYDQAMACIHAGARAGTHVGNAMRLFHQHEPAIFGAIIENGLYCETIADGRHLHPGSVRFYLKAAGWDRVFGITDSIMAAGLPDGRYMLGVNEVDVIDGDARLAHGNSRAGSTLTMAQAMRNLCSFTGRGPEDISRLLSANPAVLMGWTEKGIISPGADADLVVLDAQMNVKYTIVAGSVVYSA